MINKIICDKVKKVVKGLNRPYYLNEFAIEYEGDLNSIAKYDEKSGEGVTIKQNFSLFSADEVLTIKYKQMVAKTDKNHVLADMFITEELIDYTDIKANTGVTLLELLSKGYASTKKIKLFAPTKEFLVLEANYPKGVDMFVNDVKVTGSKITFDSEVNEIVIKFVNTTSLRQKVKGYALAY